MKRQELNISDYKFVAEYFDSYLDMNQNEIVTKKFIMLRNFSLMNNIAVDDDIYFIEKEVFDEYINKLRNNEDNDLIVFPIPNTSSSGYSTSYKDFNNMYSLNGFWNEYLQTYGPDVYELYSISKETNEVSERSIRCNKIRLYHPQTKIHLDAVVDVHNHINNIHIHYLCRPLNVYSTNSETEFRVSGNIYSEFVEICVPNIDDLFKITHNDDGTKSYNTWFIENLNYAEIASSSFVSSIIEEHNGVQYLPLNLLIQPSKLTKAIIDGVETDVKEYVPLSISIENNYLTYPFNISIWPYDSISDTINTYTLSEDLLAANCTFTTDVRFSLSCKMGFYNGMVHALAKFLYPLQNNFESKYDHPVSEAYKVFNNVTDTDYGEVISDDGNGFSRYYIKRYRELYPENWWMSDTDIANEIASNEDIKEQIDDPEITDDTGTNIDFLGFKITVASDSNFKFPIYSATHSMKLSELDDFGFCMAGMFNSWNEVPEMLVAKIEFIDRYLGVSISGNPIFISPTWIKYMVDTGCQTTQLSMLTNHNAKMKEIDLGSNTQVNFINNINCMIGTSGASSQDANGRTSSATKILYKPIFFRTQDLQTIKLRQGVVQNIGINLADYMTKIETFKLVLGSNTYIETGRNDIYVLFRVDAQQLVQTDGNYNITDQDDEYISSGQWSLY